MDLFIKKLAEEFKKQFICVGENTEKYIAFTVPIEKEVTKIDKNGEHIKYIYIYIYICYILQFIDNVIELNVDLDTMIKNVKHVELNISIATVLSNMQTLMMIW